MRISFKTLGCRLNQAEAASFAGEFEAAGFAIVGEASAADVRVLHTCAVTHAAEMEALRLVRKARRATSGGIVAVTGCATATVAQRLAEAGADIVIPHSEMGTLVRRICAAVGRSAPSASCKGALPHFSTTRALVKVQDGCDFRCAYCIVPDTRGAPVSRPFEEVEDEVARVASRGYREVVLAGVNVACYNDRGRTLCDLIRSLVRIPALGRLRLSSIEPATIERELVDIMAAESRLCRTLHLPMQSGDDGILRAMRRRYTAAHYTAVVEYALERLPRVGLGTDIITGFPGETETAFANTRAMLERFPFSNAHIFPYSERPGTPAAALGGIIPVHVRRERTLELSEIAERKRAAFAQSLVGERVEVLIERVSDDGVGRGWTSEYIEAQIPGLTPEAIGTIVEKIQLSNAWTSQNSALPFSTNTPKSPLG